MILVKIITRIVECLVNILTMFLIVVGFGYIVLALIGITPYVVLSGSMEPTIETGSLAFINKRVKYENIKEKDIIAFNMTDSTMITHRAIAITNNGIQTKGDNNEIMDGVLTTKDNFVGKNIFWIPKVGFLIKKFQTPKGVISFISFTIALFMIGILVSSFNEDDIELDDKYALNISDFDLFIKNKFKKSKMNN